MAYIQTLDPDHRDPQLDVPFQCEACGWRGTYEDCYRVLIHDGYGGSEAADLVECPDCEHENPLLTCEDVR